MAGKVSDCAREIIPKILDFLSLEQQKWDSLKPIDSAELIQYKANLETLIEKIARDIGYATLFEQTTKESMEHSWKENPLVYQTFIEQLWRRWREKSEMPRAWTIKLVDFADFLRQWEKELNS